LATEGALVKRWLLCGAFGAGFSSVSHEWDLSSLAPTVSRFFLAIHVPLAGGLVGFEQYFQGESEMPAATAL
jgi:hypothetical protein